MDTDETESEPTEARPAAAEQGEYCIRCGRYLRPEQVVVLWGRPCPLCGQPWGIGQVGGGQPVGGRQERLRQLRSWLGAFLLCFGVVGLSLGFVVAMGWEGAREPCDPSEMFSFCGLRSAPLYAGALLIFVVEAAILGFWAGQRRDGAVVVAGCLGVAAAGSGFWLVLGYADACVTAPLECSVQGMAGSVIFGVPASVLTAAPFVFIGAHEGAAASRPSEPNAPPPGPAAPGSMLHDANESEPLAAASGDYLCVNCGKDLGPGLAVVYRGQPCPNCGRAWERTSAGASTSRAGAVGEGWTVGCGQVSLVLGVVCAVAWILGSALGGWPSVLLLWIGALGIASSRSTRLWQKLLLLAAASAWGIFVLTPSL